MFPSFDKILCPEIYVSSLQMIAPEKPSVGHFYGFAAYYA